MHGSATDTHVQSEVEIQNGERTLVRCGDQVVDGVGGTGQWWRRDGMLRGAGQQGEIGVWMEIDLGGAAALRLGRVAFAREPEGGRDLWRRKTMSKRRTVSNMGEFC